MALGADAVLVLPRDEDTLAGVLADRADGPRAEAPLLAFVGGCGGAGASSLAAAVAADAAAGHDGGVLLVDGDPLGGGVDLLLGDEDVPGLRWGDLATTHGRLSGAALRRSLPRSGGLTMLSWERGGGDGAPTEVVRAVLAAARRAHDLVVVDLPRHLEPPVGDVVTRASATVVVVPDDVRSVGAATGVVRRLADWTSVLRVAVRQRRGGLPASLVAETLAIPLVATVPDDVRFRRAIEEGVGPVARRTAVRSAARAVRTRLRSELAR